MMEEQEQQTTPIEVPQRKIPAQFVISQLRQRLADREMEVVTLQGQLIVMQQEINDLRGGGGTNGVA